MRLGDTLQISEYHTIWSSYRLYHTNYILRDYGGCKYQNMFPSLLVRHSFMSSQTYVAEFGILQSVSHLMPFAQPIKNKEIACRPNQLAHSHHHSTHTHARIETLPTKSMLAYQQLAQGKNLERHNYFMGSTYLRGI